jgi:serine protease Do
MKTYGLRLAWLLAMAASITGLVGLPAALLRAEGQSATQEVEAARAALPRLEQGDTLSPLFHAVAEAVRPAVVMVEVAQQVKQSPSTESGLGGFLRHLFGDSGSESETKYIYGLGSGIVVDARNGYILTNWHVVHGANSIEVILPDGRHVRTQWVRSDHLTDLAVVKIDVPDLVSVPLGDSAKVVVGDLVLAIGAPEGMRQTVTSGIISAKGRTISEDYESFLQTDASINPGNSGGPLVSMKGEVIGINTAIISPVRINAGLGLAIPSNTAKYVMTQLIEKGKVVRGYLGVEVQDVSEKLAGSFDLPTTKGALVSKVVPDGPAARVGIEPEDFITALDGKPVDNSAALRRIVIRLTPGREVPVEFYRHGEEQTVQVQVGTLPEKPSAPPQTAPAVTPGRFGISVTTLTPRLARKYSYQTSVRGALITAVQPGSEAAFVGLLPGMVILKVQNQTVTTGQQADRALSALKPGEGVRLLVTDPGGVQVYVFVPAT